MALLHIRLTSLGPPPSRHPFGSQLTGSRMTWVLVSSTTEATQSLLEWTEGKLAFTFTPAQSSGLLTNAQSHLKTTLLECNLEFSIEEGLSEVIGKPVQSNEKPASFQQAANRASLTWLFENVLVDFITRFIS